MVHIAQSAVGEGVADIRRAQHVDAIAHDGNHEQDEQGESHLRRFFERGHVLQQAQRQDDDGRQDNFPDVQITYPFGIGRQAENGHQQVRSQDDGEDARQEVGKNHRPRAGVEALLAKHTLHQLGIAVMNAPQARRINSLVGCGRGGGGAQTIPLLTTKTRASSKLAYLRRAARQ